MRVHMLAFAYKYPIPACIIYSHTCKFHLDSCDCVVLTLPGKTFKESKLIICVCICMELKQLKENVSAYDSQVNNTLHQRCVNKKSLPCHQRCPCISCALPRLTDSHGYKNPPNSKHAHTT